MKPLIFLILWIFSSALFAGSESCWEKALTKAVSGRLPAGARVVVEKLRAQGPCTKTQVVDSLLPDSGLGFVTFNSGTAQVRAFVPVAVANQPLSHGESLTEENVRFEERELSRITQNGYFATKDQILGRKVKGYLSSGAVISRLNCQLPSVVAQGQSVDLVRQKGELTLVAKVKALQAGLRDQWIQVQNPSSGKILLARITGPGIVEVR